MRVGILGGSFNPPHEGHVHISMGAKKALELDVIWWLVTPQNPLKSSDETLPFEQRMALCKKQIEGQSGIIISDLEDMMHSNITYETIHKIKQLFPMTEFVWISGMDNALSLHTWNRWRDLLKLIPMIHLTRMPATSLIQGAPLRMMRTQRHVFIDKPARYALKPQTTFWHMQKKMINISSTEIRQRIHFAESN